MAGSKVLKKPGRIVWFHNQRDKDRAFSDKRLNEQFEICDTDNQEGPGQGRHTPLWI